MIADLDETIRQLLIDEMPIKNGEIEISFHQPKREWSTRLSRPTVNFYLYDLRENPTLRQQQWELVSSQARRAGGDNGGENQKGQNQARLKRSPMRMDCLYMLTTWAVEPEDEHRLMTRCLMTLFRYPILPHDRLVGSLKDPIFDIQARLAVHDRLTNPAEVWSALDNEMRPSVPYVITLALDPWMEISGPIVRTLFLRSGQSNTLPLYQQLIEGTHTEMVDIGGTVWNAEVDSQPIQGIGVAVKGTGLFDTTNAQGHFVLGSLPPGEYTLIAWPTEGKPLEKKISLAIGADAVKSNYDFEL
jgi:hypothetical protein